MAYMAHEILRLSFAEQFNVIENGLVNAKTAELTSHLALFNYTPERIDEGLDHVRLARELHSTQQKEFGEQLSATATHEAMVDAVEKRCGATWKIAKIAITDGGIRKALGIHRSRKYSHTGKKNQFEQFYRNMSPEALTYLAEYGFTQEKIDAEYQMVKEVLLAGKVQNDEMADAQGATEDRDEQIDVLHSWCRNFYKVAKIALADEPQLLEKLGIQA